MFIIKKKQLYESVGCREFKGPYKWGVTLRDKLLGLDETYLIIP